VLIAGIAVTLVATSTDSAVGFFTGTAIAGVGFGSGFQGSIRLVVPLVGEQDRAGVLSALYVVVYLGLGVPAVIGGVLVTEVNGLLATAREYGSAVVVLAALALAGLLVHRPPKAPAARQRAAAPPPFGGRADRIGSDAGPHCATVETDLPAGSPKRGTKRAIADVAALLDASKRQNRRAAPLIPCARPARGFPLVPNPRLCNPDPSGTSRLEGFSPCP
jgi:hypothetical protein